MKKQNKKVSDIPSEEIVLRLYDIGIEGCRQKDSEKVLRVLNELTASLDFRYYEMANAFQNVYKYGFKALDKGYFSEIENIFTELRSAWDSFVTTKVGLNQENLNYGAN